MTSVVDARSGLDEAAHAAVEGARDALTRARSATERARQHAYAFHRLTGEAEADLLSAVRLLRESGREDLADVVLRRLVGRSAAGDRWSFEVDETHEDDFYRTLTSVQESLAAQQRGSTSRP